MYVLVLLYRKEAQLAGVCVCALTFERAHTRIAIFNLKVKEKICKIYTVCETEMGAESC